MLRGWVVECEEHILTKVQYIFVLVVLSYPVIFALDRTNLELLLFVFVAGFFYFLYVRESPWLAALLLAAAIAFKLYPATLLLLLLAERRYKPFALTIVLAVALTAIGLVALGVVSGHSVGEVWRMSTSEKDVYQTSMVLGSGGLQHGHTLWGLLRLPGFLSDATIAAWKTTVYEAVAALIFAYLAFHVIFRETERWKRVLLSLVPAVLLPFVSADYTLIYMYFPLVFFLNASRVTRWDYLYIALFGTLLIPVDYYYLALSADGVSISVIVYPLALLALVVLAIADREPSIENPSSTPIVSN
jgi:Glycosyltransferase family 87